MDSGITSRVCTLGKLYGTAGGWEGVCGSKNWGVGRSVEVSCPKQLLLLQVLPTPVLIFKEAALKCPYFSCGCKNNAVGLLLLAGQRLHGGGGRF